MLSLQQNLLFLPKGIFVHIQGINHAFASYFPKIIPLPLLTDYAPKNRLG